MIVLEILFFSAIAFRFIEKMVVVIQSLQCRNLVTWELIPVFTLTQPDLNQIKTGFITKYDQLYCKTLRSKWRQCVHSVTVRLLVNLHLVYLKRSIIFPRLEFQRWFLQLLIIFNEISSWLFNITANIFE